MNAATLLLSTLFALAPGEPAPAFEAKNDEGQTVKLSDFQGKTVVLYFYPKDDTSGCTVQAKGFRDDMDALRSANVVVLGVSGDSLQSHQAFKKKYDLNFPLLVDEDGRLAKLYGVEKGLFGFPSRDTIIIGPDGKVAHVLRNVNPKGHAEQVRRLVQPKKG
ncbi:MAG: peroxiredoxin [Myxococcales bacterium]